KKIALLQQHNQAKAKQNVLYIIILIILIIVTIALYIAYRYKLKYAHQREQLNAEEAARLKAEQQLELQKKEQLQKEVMAGKIQIEHKNELIRDLKDKLLSHNIDGAIVRKLEKIMNEEMRIDQDFE